MIIGLEIPYYELNNGLLARRAFARIDTFQGNRNSMAIDVKVYANQSQAELGAPYIDSFIVDIPYEGGDVFEQGYEFLKTIDRFEDAKDVVSEE
ncbi:hypothetical protein [Shouchella miscanthi]|uniref:hypothetical protein n=1 Tax=Shouchella miscanthi TaxID=2598861 RepID=UPI0011A45AB6|nr:hypothetical protein [Shouchella miscanthi]